MSNSEQFKAIVDGMSELYSKKNNDYSDSFSQTMNEFGPIAAAIRLSDKLNRFKTLITSPPKILDEKLEDTLIDMANYAIMTVIWLKDHDLSSK